VLRSPSGALAATVAGRPKLFDLLPFGLDFYCSIRHVRKITYFPS
jgi:hypothetical protein